MTATEDVPQHWIVPGGKITQYIAFQYVVEPNLVDKLPDAENTVLVKVVWPGGRTLLVRFDGTTEWIDRTKEAAMPAGDRHVCGPGFDADFLQWWHEGDLPDVDVDAAPHDDLESFKKMLAERGWAIVRAVTG